MLGYDAAPITTCSGDFLKYYLSSNLIHLSDNIFDMDVFYAFSYGSAGWLTLQAVPLLISPTIIVTVLSPQARESTGQNALFRCAVYLLITV
jgi:hypothetical protein